MTVVVEVSDQWNRDAHINQSARNFRQRACSIIVVYRDPDQSASGPRQFRHLECRTQASPVSVLVMDCTTTGWGDPTGTPPTMAVTVFLRAISGHGSCGV